MQPNQLGLCPDELRFTDKRVHVVLRNGYDTRKVEGEKAGWLAHGKKGWGGCRWTLEGHESDIVEWELTK